MIEINAPGGVVLRFPDGTDPAAIQKVLRDNGLAPAETSRGIDWPDVGSGLALGTANQVSGLIGLPGDTQALGKLAVDWWTSKPPDPAGAATLLADPNLPSKVLAQRSPGPLPLPTSSDVKRAIEAWTGPLAPPKTGSGKLAQDLSEFSLGAAFPGGPVRRALNVVGPALGAEAGEAVTKGSPTGRAVGSLVGGVVGTRGITPAPATPERARLAGVLEQEGVPLTAGQRTGNQPLMWFEAAAADTPLAAGRAANLNTAQKEAFTRATLARIGEDAPRATPEVLDRALTRMGNEFDRLAANNGLPVDNQLVQELRRIGGNYRISVPQSQQAEIVQATIDGIIRNQGGMTRGNFYQALRSGIDRVIRRTNDPELKETLHEIRYAVDDAVERGMQWSGNTQDMAAWREVRRQYRNYIPIEIAATGPGAATAEGLIGVSQLRNAVVSQHGRRNYARGEGDLAEFSRAGEALLKPLPQSGTAPRAQAASAFGSIGGMMVGNQVAGAEGALAGMAAPWIIGRTLLSTPAQIYLGNQLLPLTHQQLLRRIGAQQIMGRPEQSRQ